MPMPPVVVFSTTSDIEASVVLALLAPPLPAQDIAQRDLGKRLFTTTVPACSVCHTLKDAGTEGRVGPVLDELKPDAARVAKALRDGIGNMPSFRATLSAAEIEALAFYVSRASGGEP